MSLTAEKKKLVFVAIKHALHDSSSSSSSSSEDSENEYHIITDTRIKRVKIEGYIEVIQKYTDMDFQSHFRLTRNKTEVLVQDIAPFYNISTKKYGIPTDKALLIAIWTLANQECYRSIADRFGISRGNCHEIVMKIVKILYNMKEKYIKWPHDYASVSKQFSTLRGNYSFPNTIGCVDATHIPIPGPRFDNSYYNHKGYHSILLQVVCNSSMEFTDVYCGWPGSVNDARMWKASPLYNILQTSRNTLHGQYHLLGDSAYPLDVFLMSPFRDNGHLTDAEINFNTRLSRTRVIIEQAIGRLKNLFRRLKYLEIYNLSYAKYYIMAACILHNLCINEDIVIEFDCQEDTNAEISNNEEDLQLGHGRNIMAQSKRQFLMNTLSLTDL